MMKRLVKKELTTEQRIEQISDLEGEFNFAENMITGTIQTEERTHTPSINFNTGECDCDCEDFNLNKKICSHLLAELVCLKNESENLFEHFINTAEAHNKFQKTKEKKLSCLTTGSKSIDAIYGGGIPLKALAGVYSLKNVGKTILCHQIAANCWKNLKKHAYYIDTEQAFVREEEANTIQEWFRKRYDIPDFKIDYKFYPDIYTLFRKFGWTVRVRYGEKGKMDSILMPSIDEETMSEVEAAISTGDYKILILDSITMPVEGLMGSGQENFPGRKPLYSNLLMSMRNIAVKYNIAAFVTAHESPRIGMGGSSGFKGGSALGFGIKFWAQLGGGEKIGERWFWRDRAGYLPHDEVEVKLKKNNGFGDI